MFPEGTRYNPDLPCTIEQSRHYAASQGLTTAVKQCPMMCTWWTILSGEVRVIVDKCGWLWCRLAGARQRADSTGQGSAVVC